MLAKLKRSFKRAYVRSIRARQERAAMNAAMHLKMYNSDFKTCSVIDLQHAIMSKKPLSISEIGK